MLTKEELKLLAARRDGRCVSVYMPTHRAGPETQQNPIRLKNLLSEAENRLLDSGVRAPDAQTLLEPAYALLDDAWFWQHQSDGFVLFLAKDFMHYERLPLDFDELVFVADRFYIKPLLPVLSGNGQFYVLALSQQAIRLLQGTRYSVDEVQLEDVPESIDEALWFEDPERRLQFHTSTGSPGSVGGRSAVFHGHGAEEDDKEIILRYFRRVDKGLRALLGDSQAPLVLAGVEYLLPLYAEANTYPHLLSVAGIVGNPEQLSASALHKQAWAIVEPLFAQAQKAAADRYMQLSNTDQASGDLEAIVPAAHQGRVDTLFVALGEQQWGAYDPSRSNGVQFHQSAKPGDEDLLDLAAVQTLLTGGTVYATMPDAIPGEGAAAAVLRY
jgi:hypothetical protein